MLVSKQKKRMCFDIETESFSKDFEKSKDNETRLTHAPKMRLACVFDEKKWYYFLPSEVSNLIKLLNSADEIITFNGKNFDELVLRKHYGLINAFPSNGIHIDIHQICFDEVGRRISLDKLVQLNLGERKYIEGKRMVELGISALKKACHSDVWQTYRLWKLWDKNKLFIPDSKFQEVDIGGPGEFIPDTCPCCHSVNTLEVLDDDTSEMSEGQFAEYMAGTWGTAVCSSCKFQVDWEI